MPLSMNLPLECNTIQNQLFTAQIEASLPTKKNCWKQVIEQKIYNQALVLEKYGHNSRYLEKISKEVKSDDSTNREGVAAKIYWNELFGNDFVRSREGIEPNNLLNYGYTLLRAAVARALMGSGLLPAFGIFHRNRYNAFPLADDIMEPYRPYVDEIVYHMYINGIKNLDKEAKSRLLNLLFADTVFSKVTRPLEVGLTTTTASLAKCYMGTIKNISYPLLE